MPQGELCPVVFLCPKTAGRYFPAAFCVQKNGGDIYDTKYFVFNNQD
jgi:hypothetical protein